MANCWAAVFDVILRSGVCDRADASDTKSTCHTNAVRKVLRNDFLSPLVASMLFPDFAARIVPNLGAFGVTESWSRARRLEEAFDDALSRFLSEQGFDEERVEALLSGPILASRGLAGRPFLLINTTDVGSGERMVISSLHSFHDDPPTLGSRVSTYVDVTDCGENAKCQGPDTLAAALVSARFPYMTPAAEIEISDGNGGSVRARYVDGGYFENSGVETARDFMLGINPGATRYDWPYKKFQLLVTMFPNISAKERERSYALDELLAPVRALSGARSARGEMAKRRAFAVSAATDRFIPYALMLDNTKRDFTLGWSLSQNTFDRIECNLGFLPACQSSGILPEMDEPSFGPSFDPADIVANNVCVLADITNEFDEMSPEFSHCPTSSSGSW